MLRYSDDTFTAEQKKLYHAFLAKKLKEKAPTATEEAKDPGKADGFYRRGGDWLRNATRDTKRFHILFDENITYGFRRNLYGLRWAALGANAAIVVVAFIALVWFLPNNLTVPAVQRLYAVLAIAVVHALFIFFHATEQSAIQAGRTYARELILSIERLRAN